MLSFADLVPHGFRGLCVLGLKHKQIKNVKGIRYKNKLLSHCEKVSFVGNTTFFFLNNVFFFPSETITFETMVVSCLVAPDASCATLQVKYL